MCVLLHQKHYPPLGLHEGVGVSHNHGIHLSTGHRLAVFAYMEPTAVDDFRYLFGLQSSVALGKDVYNGFLNLHSNSIFMFLLRSYAFRDLCSFFGVFFLPIGHFDLVRQRYDYFAVESMSEHIPWYIF